MADGVASVGGRQVVLAGSCVVYNQADPVVLDCRGLTFTLNFDGPATEEPVTGKPSGPKALTLQLGGIADPFVWGAHVGTLEGHVLHLELGVIPVGESPNLSRIVTYTFSKGARRD